MLVKDNDSVHAYVKNQTLLVLSIQEESNHSSNWVLTASSVWSYGHIFLKLFNHWCKKHCPQPLQRLVQTTVSCHSHELILITLFLSSWPKTITSFGKLKFLHINMYVQQLLGYIDGSNLSSLMMVHQKCLNPAFMV